MEKMGTENSKNASAMMDYDLTMTKQGTTHNLNFKKTGSMYQKEEIFENIIKDTKMFI